MSKSEFDRLIEAVSPSEGQTTLTLTEFPDCYEELCSLLERALIVSARCGAPLAAIHLPLEQFETIPDSFWHVPIEDSTRDGVLRLVFERGEYVAAA